jgi:aquaporin Z
MKRYATELIGTFFLVFAIGMTATSGTAAAPLAIGSMLMVMVYMGGHVSGAPGSVYVLTGATFAPAPGADVAVGPALLAEALVTFALVLVVLNVATAEATKGNSYYGLAIGFTVAAGAYTAGPVSGGAFNPAVGIGPITVHAFSGGGSFADLWIYLVGPLAGAVAAAPVFRLQAKP